MDVFFPDFHDEVKTAFSSLVPLSKGDVTSFHLSCTLADHHAGWTKHNVPDTARRIVAQATSRLFVGLPLCTSTYISRRRVLIDLGRNPEYLEVNLKFTKQLVDSAGVTALVPNMLAPYEAFPPFDRFVVADPMIESPFPSLPTSLRGLGRQRNYCDPFSRNALPRQLMRRNGSPSWFVTHPTRQYHMLTLHRLTSFHCYCNERKESREPSRILHHVSSSSVLAQYIRHLGLSTQLFSFWPRILSTYLLFAKKPNR